ncbi:unnamed protein product [Hymenolepis diminuta]|uniref:RRM domain-containing protein n=1 Tax=Hymenolepis diminuta TaxID=6216 RepID=A0A0R3SG29_HYMDI|nr:unnamed protein product [Hymenolepis diminuta]
MSPSQQRNGGNRSRSRSRSNSPRRGKITSKRVVIANIPYDVTWTRLKQIFRDQVGFSGYLRLMKTNGRPNGMGLMEFKTVEGAEKAIEKMHRYEIEGRRIIVREETLRDQERMANMEFDGPANSSMDGPMGQMGMPPPPQNVGPGMPPQDRGYGVGNMGAPPVANLTPNMLESMGVRGPITDSLYVSNLDYSVDWRKVKDIFKQAGRVVHATVKQDDEGRSKGVAVVRFEHPYEALFAWAMLNGYTINDRPIRIKIDRDGKIAPSNMPIFPPPPKGAAIASGFMTYFSKMNVGNSAAPPPGANQPPMQPQQQPPYGGPPGSNFMSQPQQSQQGQMGGGPNQGIAAAMAALMGGANRGGMPVPPNQQEIMGSLLGAASAGGFPQSQIGNQSISYGGDRSRDPNSTVQQLMMAAAAGGMPQEQIAQAISALGLNRDPPGMNAYSGGPMGGMPSTPIGGGSDPYGDRGVGMTPSRSPGSSGFDSRQRFREPSNSRGGPGMPGSGQRNFRQGGGSSDTMRTPGSRGMARGPDMDRMYMRRVSLLET